MGGMGLDWIGFSEALVGTYLLLTPMRLLCKCSQRIVYESTLRSAEVERILPLA